MQIKITYCGTLNGVYGIWCGFLPEGVIVEEERPVLYADEGKILERISDKERMNCVWLRDGDVQENYMEVEDDN